MMASRLKFLLLTIMATDLLGVGSAIAVGKPQLALAIVFGPPAAYGVILAFELIMAFRCNRQQSVPRAGPAALAQAWATEFRAGIRVFCWNQPFLAHTWPDHLVPAGAEPARGVILVHGFVCNRGVWNSWLERLAHRSIPVIAVNLEPVFCGIDRYAAAIEDAVLAMTDATGLAPIVVAHSMGGLVVRHWWALPGNRSRLQHVITLGTPHHGTWLARFSPSANARQMRLGSAWLHALQQRERGSPASDMTCFYSHCDNVVFPALTASMAGADNRHLDHAAHLAMLSRAEPFHALMGHLQACHMKA
jgi:triacylglycerol esterase/lipase EstA (alpha/beta hydrolase family)